MSHMDECMMCHRKWRCDDGMHNNPKESMCIDCWSHYTTYGYVSEDEH